MNLLMLLMWLMNDKIYLSILFTSPREKGHREWRVFRPFNGEGSWMAGIVAWMGRIVSHRGKVGGNAPHRYIMHSYASPLHRH